MIIFSHLLSQLVPLIASRLDHNLIIWSVWEFLGSTGKGRLKIGVDYSTGSKSSKCCTN